jgi:predicted TIM-barrel fold metal-dependent hydrolase
MPVGTDDRYLVISADCHAGGSIDAYAEYLDPGLRDDFAAWRGAYKNPFRDLQGDGRTRNWDSERRFADLEADGQVAEVVFPNTVPPFFPTGMLVARPPTAADLEQRWAGLRAHNRWLADWCAEHPERRAGVAVVFLNDVDAAVAEARWAHEHGLRGGIMIPAVPDDTDIEPLYSRAYDPLWRTCEELGIIVNSHAGSGHPDYGDHVASQFMWAVETDWFAHRVLWQVVMSGVFERFPELRFVMTEQGCSWVPQTLARLDGMHMAAASGRMGELRMDPEANLSMLPSEYFRRNVWVGVSFAGRRDAAAMQKLGLDRMMWGSDYPHHEGSTPFSKDLMRRAFHDWSSDDLDQVLTRTTADLYGFDVAALTDVAERVGPTVAELQVPLEGVPKGATSPGFYL